MVSYEHSELGVLYPDRGVAELPVLDREHDVLIEHGDAEPAQQIAGSSGVSHSIRGPADITEVLELFDRLTVTCRARAIHTARRIRTTRRAGSISSSAGARAAAVAPNEPWPTPFYSTPANA
jgi:hypothetical protein